MRASFFWFCGFFSLFLILLAFVQLVVRRRTIARLMILNMVASQICVLLALLAALMDEYSLLDMSFMYLLLGPAVMMFVFIYNKYKPQDKAKLDVVNETNSVSPNLRLVASGNVEELSSVAKQEKRAEEAQSWWHRKAMKATLKRPL